MSRLIATVFLKGQGVNKVVATGPGRSLQFRGGSASVTDERDMPAALALHGVQIAVEPGWIDFVGQWAARCPTNTPAVAQVIASGEDADRILIGDAPEYLVLRPEPTPVEPFEEPPALGPDPRWIGRPRRRGAAAVAE